MTCNENGVKSLQLFGEHINLSSRTRLSDDAKKFRPQSALYTTTKYTPEHNRRPFSAGTEPTSPKLLSFLRHTQTDRPDSYYLRNNEYSKDLLIPGAVESSALCEKLIKESVSGGDFTKRKFYYDVPEQQSNASDNYSENSSLETCISLGTKIKARAQIFDKSPNNIADCEIEGTSINLKKLRPYSNVSVEKYFDNILSKKSLNVIPEKDFNLPNSKLLIHVPTTKEENTSSGVSSSSDVHTICNKKPSELQDVHKLKRDESLFQYRPISKRVPNYSSNSSLGNSLNNCERYINGMDFINTVSTKLSSNKNQESNKSSDSLVGRVSFSNQHIEEESFENVDDPCDPFSTFDTQLSLVEEESSQGSDKTMNLLTSDYKSNIHDHLPYTHFKRIPFETKPFDINSVSINNTYDEHYMKQSGEKITFRNNDQEMKYKILEEKYKSERCNAGKLNKTNHRESLNNNEYLIDDEHSNAYENNTLSDQNFNIESVKYDLSETSNEQTNGNQSNLYYSNTYYETTGKDSIDKDNNMTASSDVCLFSNKSKDEHESNDFVKDSFYVQEKNHENNTTMFDEVSDLCKSEILIKENIENVPINSPKDYRHNSKYFTENSSTLQNEAKHTNTEFDVRDKTIEYPQYLEENETKSYTSKVVEEYKKDISSINNFHNLTLQDLRNNRNEFRIKGEFDSFPNKNFNNTSSSMSDDDMTITLNSTQDGKKPFDERFYKKNKSNKYSHPKKSELFTFKHSSTDENLYKNSYSQNKEKYKTAKIKTRTKKKDTVHEYKHKHNNDEFKTKKPNHTKKSGYDYKRSEENSSKANRSMVKFKAQKILLTKSSTKINHTVYMDNDRDVVSWMATRIHTPSGDISSCENTDRSKLFKDSKFQDKEKEKPVRNTVHFEDEIVPVVKLKLDTSLASNDENTNDFTFSDLQTITKMNNITEEPERTDSEIDIIKFSPPSDFSNSSDKFDLDSNNAASAALEGTSMISDIYSTLNDIETHYNTSTLIYPKVPVSYEDIEESVTTEFKDIATYLERAEKNANEDMTSLSHNQPLFALKVEELMELSKAELAHRAVTSALAAGRASAIASGLKGALAQAAKVSAARLRAIKASAKQDATIAAAQTAQTLAKHQKFIEQLVDEKRALTERIEQLAGTAAGAEARRERSARVAAERLQLELRNQRQRLNGAHQRDKQAWLKHHTAKIKEMTVKELESELRDIEKSHTVHVDEIQRDADASLADLREEHAKEIRKLKDNAARQLEDELDKERLLATERLEQKRVEWEAAMINASERAGLEAKDAARKIEEVARNARRESELWKVEQEEELVRQRRLLEKQISEEKSNIKDEIKIYKDKLIKEFENHKIEYSKRQEIVLKEKEADIRLSLRRDRDVEIEKAIDCIEKEAQEGRNDMQKTIKKLKEKSESDKRILEESEKIANQRCDELKDQLVKSQEQCSKFQITVTQLEGKLKHAEEINVQNSAQTEILVKAAELRGQESLLEIERRLQDLQRRHKDEMHQLFAKVKVVIARKDDALNLARREAASLRERRMRLEAEHI